LLLEKLSKYCLLKFKPTYNHKSVPQPTVVTCPMVATVWTTTITENCALLGYYAASSSNFLLTGCPDSWRRDWQVVQKCQ